MPGEPSGIPAHAYSGDILRLLAQEALDHDSGNVPFDDIPSKLGGMAREHGRGHFIVDLEIVVLLNVLGLN